MRLRTTHTFVNLEISESAFNEIWTKLRDAGYQHTFIDELTIDMSGIAVTPEIHLPEESLAVQASVYREELTQMPVVGESGGGLSCEQQLPVCQAAAEAWLRTANANAGSGIIGEARKRTNQFLYEIMLANCLLAEAACIAARNGAGVVKKIQPYAQVVLDAALIIGAIIVIGSIIYVVFSTAPLILIAVL